MRTYISKIALFFGLALSIACEKQSTTNDCGTVATSGGCATGSGSGVDANLYKISFSDSYFYDLLSGEWVTISGTDLTSGSISSTINVYSANLSNTTTASISSAKLAESQKVAGTKTGVNNTPYFKFKINDGVTYLFRYRKYNTSKTLLYEKLGQVTTDSGYGYIPLINEYFDSQFYPTGTAVGTSYKNEITITAQANKLSGSPTVFTFNTILTTPNLDNTIELASAMNGFTVADRWKYYVDPNSLATNSKLDFVKLIDNTSTINSSLTDVRIVFADNFKITIEEQVFFEAPLLLSTFLASKTVVPARGSAFYYNTLTLDSINDFRHKIYIGDTLATQSSKTFTVSSLAVGKNYNIVISLDFTSNATYGVTNGDPNGKGLLYPLQPLCNLLSGSNYIPWIKESQVAASVAAGNTHTICNLDTDAEQIITPTNPSGLSLIDTWFKAFNFSPYNSSKNELGNFSGIKQIKISTSGCYQIQTKDPSMSTWTTKTVGGNACNSSSPSDKTWSYFSYDKTYTIYDSVTQYSAVPGLSTVLSILSTASPTLRTNMKFNNEKLSGNTIRHLY